MVRLIWLATFIIVSETMNAKEQQSDNGIYLTLQDYKNGLLTFASTKKEDKLHELESGDILLVRDGADKRYAFGTFYAYRRDGFNFISFGKKSLFKLYGYYQVLDTSFLTVYHQRIPHAFFTYTEEPYFSLSPDSKKYPLTIRNLKRVVRPDTKTIQECRWFNKNMGSLAKFINNRTVINSLLIMSEQSNSKMQQPTTHPDLESEP